MRLRALAIERLPGIRPGFTLEDLAPGVNVVVGPNAVGKSSLVRALRAALYREEERDAGVHVEATFDDEDSGATLTALRIGTSLYWQQAGQTVDAPPLPERRFLPCYALGVEDLLADDHATDEAIAERLARELAGGYDLRAVREAFPFRVKATHGRDEARNLQAADRALRERQREREQLAADEARLDDLRERKAAAERARDEAERLDRALELLDQRRRHRALTEQLADFPDGMERLRGDEGEQLEGLREQLAQRREDRRRAGERRAAAVEALEQSGLAESGLDAAALADERRRIDQLHRAETQREQKATELERAKATLASTAEALGGEPERPVRLDPATVQTVERELEARRSTEADRARLAHEHEQLPGDDEEGGDPEPLRAARRELLQWLAAPRRPPWTAARILGAIGVLGAAGAGIGLAAAFHHLGWLGLLVPLAAGALALVLPRPGERERRAAEQRFARTGQAPPEAWQDEAVAQRLRALDEAVVAAERLQRALERRGAVERAIAARDEQLRDIDERLRAVAAEVGFDPAALDASFQRWLRLVADWDQARRDVAAVEAEHGRHERAAEALRAQVVAFLDGHGLAPAADEADADTLGDRLERLGARVEQRDEARRGIAGADDEIERLDRAIAEAEQQVRGLFERVGLEAGDDDGLRRRLEHFEAWQRLREELRDVRGRQADREERLGEREDLVERVDADDEEGLRAERDARRDEAGELEELIREIKGIEDAVERAGRERALEAARDERQRARDALADRLDEAQFAEAGRFLLERVEAEHEQAVQPAALRQAREWFARFTRHQYELVFGGSAGTGFAANETATGEHRRLAELSSGTRMQLLLAVRVAFARDAERGARKLPLVLDEALTTADPERFRAAAASLALLSAEEGRQVFYLTAQPADVSFWAEQDPGVKTVDLAAARGRAAAITDAAALEPPARPEVPAPGGRSAAEYGVALGVPAIDPWAAASDIHLFHLLRDDLGLLHRLLSLGVDRLGPLESLLASPAVGSALSDDEVRRLRARTEGARAWIAAWRHGRGRPVDRAALEASEAVSDKFIDRVAALNERLGGDGARLIERLAAGDVPRFQADKREALHAWLAEQGYIARDEPLAAADVELRVRAAVAEQLPAGADAAAEGRALVACLDAGMGAESSE